MKDIIANLKRWTHGLIDSKHEYFIFICQSSSTYMFIYFSIKEQYNIDSFHTNFDNKKLLLFRVLKQACIHSIDIFFIMYIAYDILQPSQYLILKLSDSSLANHRILPTAAVLIYFTQYWLLRIKFVCFISTHSGRHSPSAALQGSNIITFWHIIK